MLPLPATSPVAEALAPPAGPEVSGPGEVAAASGSALTTVEASAPVVQVSPPAEPTQEAEAAASAAQGPAEAVQAVALAGTGALPPEAAVAPAPAAQEEVGPVVPPAHASPSQASVPVAAAPGPSGLLASLSEWPPLPAPLASPTASVVPAGVLAPPGASLLATVTAAEAGPGGPAQPPPGPLAIPLGPTPNELLAAQGMLALAVATPVPGDPVVVLDDEASSLPNFSEAEGEALAPQPAEAPAPGRLPAPPALRPGGARERSASARSVRWADDLDRPAGEEVDVAAALGPWQGQPSPPAGSEVEGPHAAHAPILLDLPGASAQVAGAGLQEAAPPQPAQGEAPDWGAAHLHAEGPGAAAPGLSDDDEITGARRRFREIEELERQAALAAPWVPGQAAGSAAPSGVPEPPPAPARSAAPARPPAPPGVPEPPPACRERQGTPHPRPRRGRSRRQRPASAGPPDHPPAPTPGLAAVGLATGVGVLEGAGVSAVAAFAAGIPLAEFAARMGLRGRAPGTGDLLQNIRRAARRAASAWNRGRRQESPPPGGLGHPLAVLPDPLHGGGGGR